jgi:hypothetical protein
MLWVQKMKVTDLFFEKGKFTTLFVCVLLLSASLVTPVFAQLIKETSDSTPSAQVWNLTNDDGQTATVIVEPFTYSGTFSETSSSAGWWMIDNTGAQAFRFNIGGNIAHSSQGDEWTFVNFGGSGGGYQSIGTASGTANGNFPYATEVSGTYTLTTTSGFGTASGSGTWSGVLVSGAPSSSPTPYSSSAPYSSSTPSSQYSPSPTNPPMAARYYSDVASVKGQAWAVSNNGNSALTSGQIASGSEIQTGSDGIVGFEPPNQGGEVYLGANSIAGFVGLTSEPAPDNGIQYMIYPPVASGVIFPNGMEQLSEMKYSIPLDVAFAVLLFSEPLGQAAAIGLFIEGGAFLIPNGVAYVKETVSHLIAVPQGALAGENTEYTVNVSSDGTTTVQVLDGPVYFMDPVSNNTVTVNTNQVLTLPPAQANGFTAQELQSDVSALNPASVDHWWTQGAANAFSLNGLMSQTAIIAIVAVVVVIAVVAIVASVARKRRVIRQIHESESSVNAPRTA